MNAIIVARKPAFVSSNGFLNRLKKKYNTKKAGFSGTLDPFAKGCLVVAFGEYTKLLPYLNLAPKTYIATLWLGAKSESLDIERANDIKILDKFELQKIEKAVNDLKDIKSIKPPKFCARWVNGKRAYELARSGADFDLQDMAIDVFESSLINYSHPFVTFSVTVSKGTYVRTLGELVAKSLGVDGSLCALERASEGVFKFKNYQHENLRDIINLPKNRCFRDIDFIKNGKKLCLDDFEIKEYGDYLCEFESFFSIIRITEQKISYLLNDIKKGLDC